MLVCDTVVVLIHQLVVQNADRDVVLNTGVWLRTPNPTFAFPSSPHRQFPPFHLHLKPQPAPSCTPPLPACPLLPALRLLPLPVRAPALFPPALPQPHRCVCARHPTHLTAATTPPRLDRCRFAGAPPSPFVICCRCGTFTTVRFLVFGRFAVVVPLDVRLWCQVCLVRQASACFYRSRVGFPAALLPPPRFADLRHS